MAAGETADGSSDAAVALRYPKAIAGLTYTPTDGPGSAAVVKHPTGSRYFRVSAGTVVALSAMDGTRSIDQLGRALGVPAARLEDLVSHLSEVGLLEDVPDDATRRPAYGVADLGLPPWFQRIVFIKLPVIFPDRLVEKLYRGLRLHRFFGTPALLLFLAAGLGGLGAVATRPALVADGMSAATNPQWSWLVVLTLVVKRPIHELGHALACRYYGQPVGGVGAGLYFFLPVFFVDASSAWMLPSRSARLWVHLAGLVADLAVLFAVLVVALVFPDWAAAQLIAGFLLVTVTISVVFVLNPMLKLDGYFILCDLVDTRNLRERAFGALLTVVRTVLARFGLQVTRGAYPTVWSIGAVGLLCYALVAFVYTGVIIGLAAHRVSLWLAESGAVAPIVVVTPYALAAGMFALFVYFIWRASVTSSYRRF